MNYSQLCTNIQDVCENTFTADQLALFTQQAEQKIYSSVYLPALRKNVTGAFAANDRYLVFPTDLLYPLSLAVISNTGEYTYLLNKDETFMREAYPNPNTTGVPKHYGFFDQTSFVVGPTPGAAYTAELHYGYYPESIVTAGNTWLGTEFDSALLNGALVEALRFIKGPEDLTALYSKLYMESLALLKNLGDGKMREDVYRSGQLRVKPG